jgi:hypothetical protein
VQWRSFYNKRDGSEKRIEFDVIIYSDIRWKAENFCLCYGWRAGIIDERVLFLNNLHIDVNIL